MTKIDIPPIETVDRRTLLKLAVMGGAAATLPVGSAQAAKVPTSARIVILGAGAAGLAAANRLADRLDGAKITLIDGRKAHYYQPGYTLIAGGLKPANYSVSQTTDYMPDGVDLIAEAAAEIDPEGRTVTTASGRRVAYDYLMLASGMVLDYDAIEGMSLDLIGKNGIGSVYAGPEYAAKTWAEMDRFTDKGGVGLFHRPATEMKCAGAPLKYTFITEDYLQRKGTRGNTEMIYAAQSGSLFSVPIVAEKVRMLFRERGVDVVHNHVLKAINPSRKIATFTTPDGETEIGYDFMNVIPPMKAPDVVMNSPLPWRTGQWADEGWAEVDRATLRHVIYPDVFAIGDSAGVPKGKTAASVKWQVPVAVDHLVADIAGKTSDAVYDGYTSCPLITRLGRAMLVEFDYENNLKPSFENVVAPLEELWVSWVMKTIALKPTYISMLRGRA